MELNSGEVEQQYYDELSMEIQEWEHDALERYPRIISEGEYDISHIYQIYIWCKEVRERFDPKVTGETELAFAKNHSSEVTSEIRNASQEETLIGMIEQIMSLNGVDITVATAIVTFKTKQSSIVLDSALLESLVAIGEIDANAIPSLPNIETYDRVFDVCHSLANECGVTLRTLDRALWLHSKNEVAFTL